MVQLQERPSPAEAQVDTDAAWLSTEMSAREAVCSLEEAIQLIQEDTGLRRLQSSLPRRRLAIKTLLEKLLSASRQVHEFLKQFSSLRSGIRILQRKLQATAGTHKKVLHEMEALSSGMEVTARQMQQSPASEISKQSGSASSDTRRELMKLKEINASLNRDNEAKTAALEVSERGRVCALDQAEKHKEVIARTTADNMILLLKLKKTEEDFHVSKAKQDELQKQVDFYRCGWFEEASAEIEDAVKGSLDKAEACNIELESLRKQQELRIRECEQKLKFLGEKLEEARVARSTLEARLKNVEDEKGNLLKEIEQHTAKREQLETEARMLASTVDKSQLEVAEVRALYSALLEEDKLRRIELSASGEKEQRLNASLASLSSQLETQRAINCALMKKKEEVEWLCLEAQAERAKLKQQLRSIVTVTAS